MHKHILVINEFFHPDICASAAVLSDRLPRIARLRPDYKITVITGNRAWDNPAITHLETEDYQGVRIVRVNRPVVDRGNLLRRGVGFALFERAAVRAARRLDTIDLVIGTTAPPQGVRIARRIARRRGCPYIDCVFDLYPDLAATLGKISDRSFLFKRWLAKDTRLMREAACVVSIGQGITDRIARTRKVESQRLRTIHDGFDAARLGSTEENRFRRKYNPDGKFVVQYAGNMGLSHPFGSILTACQALGSEPDLLFQFIGDGPQRAAIRDRLPPNGQLIDYQPAERLGEVLDAADLCLISQHEAMYDQALPYKIYAILAAGRPSIFVGSEKSEIAEWLRGHRAGV
ncbi:MAG: glycosyltransferase family 4 protein, partial [Phycisphaerae bacterium]